jgi:hypothetical protein
VLNTSLIDALEIEGVDGVLYWFDQAMWVLEQERPKKGKG